MMNIRTLRDGTFVRGYLLDYLWHGFTLANLAYERYKFTNGKFSVIAPDSTDVDQITNFGWEISGTDHSAAIALLMRVVKRFIGNRASTVLLQDKHGIDDAHWKECEFKDRATRFNSELYWEIKGPDIPEHEIEKLISDWSSYFPVAAFFCVSPSLDRKNRLAKTDLEYLAEHLVGVAVDVFDGDSFLIWWQDDLS